MSELTKKDIAKSIGWLDESFSETGIEFDSCDWSKADETGDVHIEGQIKSTGDYIEATVRILSFSTYPADTWDPDDDEGDED